MALAVRVVKTKPDFRALRGLFVEYEADLPPHLRHGTVPELGELVKVYSGRSRAFLAVADGIAIGCVAVRKFDPETALLIRLYVKPERRGLGAARTLVEAAIGFARTFGYRRVVLDTNKAALEPAFRLYRSLGFGECAPFAEVSYECPTFMELPLT
ncbi:MAG TPA: GNAT family N-acetyltransferase [Candidatus Acidoferrum sp.]|nr:GNAT family N-acetyltransferase [Candidatus Acidoferrum sp.]